MRPHDGSLRRAALLAVILASCPVLAAQAQDAGFGKQIPLKSAVKQIVPEGTEVSMGPGVDGDAKVSWDGGGWKEALGGAARGAGYSMSVSGNTVRITKSGARVATSEAAGEPQASASRSARDDGFEPVAAPPSKAARVRRQAEERAEARVASRAGRRHERAVRHVRREEPRGRPGRREVVEARGETVSGGGFVMLPVRSAAVEGVAPPEARPARPVSKGAWREASADGAVHAGPPQAGALVVRENDNLREVLGEWSARNGWTLVWESEFSYRMSSAAKFEGEFISATSDLVKSMRHVRPLLTVQFFKANRTLVVANASSDAAGQ